MQSGTHLGPFGDEGNAAEAAHSRNSQQVRGQLQRRPLFAEAQLLHATYAHFVMGLMIPVLLQKFVSGGRVLDVNGAAVPLDGLALLRASTFHPPTAHNLDLFR